jgi:SAM-dependent methyltransferase
MDVWATGDAYEPYVGRWSRLVADEFLRWLSMPPHKRWLDLGCGTGALTEAILAHVQPQEVWAVDSSEGYLAFARRRVRDDRIRFRLGNAQALPLGSDIFDVAVSGLMLNFLPDPARGLTEMARVTGTGGLLAAYVWDYADGMQLMRYFWDAAVDLDPGARDLDEGLRFPLCRPEALERLFRDCGLDAITICAIDVATAFPDFEAYWSPFLGGQGPAPGYAVALSPDRQQALRELVRSRLPAAPDGSIRLTARAWAVQGTVP